MQNNTHQKRATRDTNVPAIFKKLLIFKRTRNIRNRNISDTSNNYEITKILFTCAQGRNKLSEFV